ncbi:MAG TPA: GNAT family N-acetyltransferase [Thermoanaerobaculia bacterium]
MDAADYLRRKGTDAPLEVLRAEVEAAFRSFEEAAAACPRGLRTRKPNARTWSPAELVDHLVVTGEAGLGELRSLLRGERPAGEPVPAHLRSETVAPWETLLARLRQLHAEVLAAIAVNAPHEVRTPTVMVVEGREWLEELDWKAYVQALFRVHTAQHRKQLRRIVGTLARVTLPTARYVLVPVGGNDGTNGTNRTNGTNGTTATGTDAADHGSPIRPISPIGPIRPIVPPDGADDAAVLHDLWTDPGVRRYLFDDRVLTPEETAAYLDLSAQSFEVHGAGLWLVKDAAGSGDAVGFAGLLSNALLFGVRPSHWGQGIAFEAATAVLEHARTDLQVDRVVADVDEPNAVSVHVLEKLGMRRVKRDIVDGKSLLYYELRLQV